MAESIERHVRTLDALAPATAFILDRPGVATHDAPIHSVVTAHNRVLRAQHPGLGFEQADRAPTHRRAGQADYGTITWRLRHAVIGIVAAVPDSPPPAHRGLIIANLGTPEAPTTEAVRAYLREFLTDKRVVQIPHLFWKPLLDGVILPRRSPVVAQKYAKIWLEGSSPLLHHTRRLAGAARHALRPTSTDLSHPADA